LNVKLAIPVSTTLAVGTVAQAVMHTYGVGGAGILVVSATSAIASVAVLLLTARALIERPVRRLLATTRSLEHGDFQARAADREEGHGDELSELARSLNAAAELAQELRDRVERAVTTDELTGLYNRHHLMETLEREIARSRRTGEPLSVVVADLDDLKALNDGTGHRAGDAALRGAAAAMQAALRESDIAARIGGDEFVAVLPGCTTSDLVSVLDRLQAATRRAADLTDGDPDAARTTLSTGATVLKGGDNAASILRRADRALYHAKRAGKNQSRIAA
jgi:diguanylate cyclase (GGDEF)-like protein